MRAQCPARRHRLKRFTQVVWGPYRAGMSAQGAPVRSRQYFRREKWLDHRPFEIRQIETRHACLLHFGRSESQADQSVNLIYGYVT